MRRHLDLGPPAALALTLALAGPAAADRIPIPQAIDALFAGFTASTPGCALGVESGDQSPIVRAYGSSDLEHDIPNRVDSVFEIGSSSKQFTAATVLLLVQDGKLSLQDDIRKFVPEIPDYGRPITIAELLGQTSGLRDWSVIAAYTGWPPGDRVYGLADVLRVAARQTALNYPPGETWSYTNTGYDLLAIIVQRVSGKSLAEVAHDRLFVPLGMSHSRFLDDFRRVVAGRAIAYRAAPTGYEQAMTLENDAGPGGLLTTVADLLTWNRALSEGRLGPFVTTELQRPTTLNDGAQIHYARGLFLENYRGFGEVAHGGAVGGYRAWVGRYPDQALSLALLCNAANADVDGLRHAVADLFLPPGAPRTPPPAVSPQPDLARFAGWYANDRWGGPLYLVADGDHVRSARSGKPLTATSGGGLRLGSLDVQAAPDGRLRVVEPNTAGMAATYTRMALAPPRPTAAQLAQIAGRYHSAETESDFIVSPKAGGLWIDVEQRPGGGLLYLPAYADAFSAGFFVMARVVRDPGGAVVALRFSDSRVWDLRAEKVKP
jgi:CubicO group peptidase (beta-lactamase class C family)